MSVPRAIIRCSAASSIRASPASFPPPTVVADLLEAHFVLLGEQHDSPTHHVLHGRLISALAARGRTSAVAMEMLDGDDEQALWRWSAAGRGDVDRLAEAVDWESSGWPDFELYRPVLTAAADAGLTITHANLSRRELAPLWQGGDMDLGAPMSERAVRGLAAEMIDAHCGVIGEATASVLADAQRVRDFHMARRMIRVGKGRGTVLIAGNDHVRTDRGVPVQLRGLLPEMSQRSVGFLEVGEGKHPAEYAPVFGSDGLPFDYVWFTPATDREDPCAAHAEALGNLANRHVDEATP